MTNRLLPASHWTLTPAIVARALEMSQEGLFPWAIAALNDVPQDVFTQWLRKGGEDHLSSTPSIEAELFAAITRGRAECFRMIMGTMISHGRGDPKQWKALESAAHILFHEHMPRKDAAAQVTVNTGPQLAVDSLRLELERVEQYAIEQDDDVIEVEAVESAPKKGATRAKPAPLQPKSYEEERKKDSGNGKKDKRKLPPRLPVY